MLPQTPFNLILANKVITEFYKIVTSGKIHRKMKTFIRAYMKTISGNYSNCHTRVTHNYLSTGAQGTLTYNYSVKKIKFFFFKFFCRFYITLFCFYKKYRNPMMVISNDKIIFGPLPGRKLNEVSPF